METTDLFCRGCGVLNSATRPHCRECGASLHGGPEAEPAPWAAPRPPVSTAVRICPRCRKGNPEDAPVCADCGARLVPSAAWPAEYTVGPDARVMVHPPLDCPACGAKMEVGTVFLEFSSFWRQMLTGCPQHPLVFRRDEALRKERLVHPDEKVHAQRCPGCNAVWIGPPKPRRSAASDETADRRDA